MKVLRLGGFVFRGLGFGVLVFIQVLVLGQCARGGGNQG